MTLQTTLMNDDVTPVTVINLRFKLWNAFTGEVMMDETFEMPEGMAIQIIRKLYRLIDSLPAEHNLDVLKTPGTKDMILELTLKRPGADKDVPGQFESLFRWAKLPELLGAGQVEVGNVPASSD